MSGQRNLGVKRSDKKADQVSSKDLSPPEDNCFTFSSSEFRELIIQYRGECVFRIDIYAYVQNAMTPNSG